MNECLNHKIDKKIGIAFGQCASTLTVGPPGYVHEAGWRNYGMIRRGIHISSNSKVQFKNQKFKSISDYKLGITLVKSASNITQGPGGIWRESWRGLKWRWIDK